METTALASLPTDWKHWVEENLERGCEPVGMIDLMMKDGSFSYQTACAAIEEASKGKISLAKPGLRMPTIDLSSNSIQTSDRRVDVLLTLKAPHIVLLGNVLSDEECDALVAYCEPRLERSHVVNDSDGTAQVHENRTSRGAMAHRGETELIARVEARLAELANWPVDHGEGLQIQHYGPGNQYRPHFDWFDPALPGAKRIIEEGGQRLATFVLYLSDVEEGGGTTFPVIGLDVLPKKGSAVFFHNTDPQQQPDRRTLHAGSPVISGVKVIANKWLRERAYI